MLVVAMQMQLDGFVLALCCTLKVYMRLRSVVKFLASQASQHTWCSIHYQYKILFFPSNFENICLFCRDCLYCQHVDPDEAVQIHKDVKSRSSIGIHWGTFILTNEVSHGFCTL